MNNAVLKLAFDAIPNMCFLLGIYNLSLTVVLISTSFLSYEKIGRLSSL